MGRLSTAVLVLAAVALLLVSGLRDSMMEAAQSIRVEVAPVQIKAVFYYDEECVAHIVITTQNPGEGQDAFCERHNQAVRSEKKEAPPHSNPSECGGIPDAFFDAVMRAARAMADRDGAGGVETSATVEPAEGNR